MKLAFGAVLALLLGVSEAGATVYDLTFPSALETTGTITTDGNTGTLSASDITSFDITGKVVFTHNFSPPNSTVSITGDALTATATQLLFNFSDTTSSLLKFFDTISLSSLQLCDATASCLDQNASPRNSSMLLVDVDPGLGATSNGVAGSGVTQIGVASTMPSVPEPSSWAMMLLGFAGLGFAGYRRARKRRVA